MFLNVKNQFCLLNDKIISVLFIFFIFSMLLYNSFGNDCCSHFACFLKSLKEGLVLFMCPSVMKEVYFLSFIIVDC